MDQALRAQQVPEEYLWRLGALAMAARTYLKFGEEQDRKRLAELVNAEFATYPDMKEVS